MLSLLYYYSSFTWFPSYSELLHCLFVCVTIACLLLLTTNTNDVFSYILFYNLLSHPPSLCILWWHLFTTQVAGCLQFCSVIWLLPVPEWGHSLGQRSKERTLTTHTHTHVEEKKHIKFWPCVCLTVYCIYKHSCRHILCMYIMFVPACARTRCVFSSYLFVCHSPCEYHHKVHDVPSVPQVRVLV